MSRPGPFRVEAASIAGEAIRRDQTLPFRFNGTSFTGHAGDTLASALLANGVRTVGRSFKFHRPRGVYTSGVEEPNAFITLGSGSRSIPVERATLVELSAGLEAFNASGWPGIGWDALRVLDFVAPVWSAGFYNKTFIWPRWHTYEDAVRRMAGFGHVPTEADPDRYESRNVHCDLLVIGAGVSGLRAATEAAATGMRVIVADQSPRLGGRCAWDGSLVDGVRGDQWVRQTLNQLAALRDVLVLANTAASGYYGRDVVTLLERRSVHDEMNRSWRERYWTVRAKRVVVACGSIEQSLVFCNNDRPGILLAGAAHEYLCRYGVAPGRRVVVATNNDSSYPLVGDLLKAGVQVLAVADTRHEPPASTVEELRQLSVPLLTGAIPVNTAGFGALSEVHIGRLSANGSRIESVQRFACDALAISGGWAPTLHLYSQAGGRLNYSARTRALAPLGEHAVVTVSSTVDAEVGIRRSPAGNPQRQWVDLRHDVTVSDLELALRENYSSIEHVKRYTTVGMAPDQGKTSHLVAMETIAELRGVPPSQIGHTTFRPPFAPVSLGAIAGRSVNERFAPSRTLPLHEWHTTNGALMEDFGEWKRPAVYLQPGESRPAAMGREALAVRNAVGLFDGSSLGKIELCGPDARAFLDRFYINDLESLQIGRVRYGLMLRETGALFDDGTVVMLAPDRFLVTTTSGNAGRVTAWFEEWHQCEWPNLRVALAAVTEQWATLSLSGPHARDVLATLACDIDLSKAAFPHLHMREGTLLGAPCRIYRVSFTGELTYEINVPARRAGLVWDALLQAGAPYALQPLGLDALMQLRLEKGFLHIGTDTDGTTVPDDIGWGRVAAKKRADFIGKRSLTLSANVEEGRLQLVGLTSDSDMVVGSHLRLTGSSAATDGWVTSAGRLTLGGQPVAMALLRDGRRHAGQKISVHDLGCETVAEIVDPPFHDRAGERMNA